MYFVYVLEHSTTHELYIGFTKDLQTRLKQHNTGDNTSTQRVSGEWEIIYTETYRSEKDARLRERRLKSHGSGKHELLKRIKNSRLMT